MDRVLLLRDPLPRSSHQSRPGPTQPGTRQIQSFDCVIDFSWKQHFTETTRVGDEGTDQELETIFQPIRTRDTVTRKNVTRQPHRRRNRQAPPRRHGRVPARARGRRSLYTWLPATTNILLPNPATPVSFKQSSSGYKLAFKMQGADIEMLLAPDMRLQSAAMKAQQSEHFDTAFAPGPQGILLASWTMGEDSEHVAIVRESHHEVWRYTLTGCSVKPVNESKLAAQPSKARISLKWPAPRLSARDITAMYGPPPDCKGKVDG